MSLNLDILRSIRESETARTLGIGLATSAVFCGLLIVTPRCTPSNVEQLRAIPTRPALPLSALNREWYYYMTPQQRAEAQSLEGHLRQYINPEYFRNYIHGTYPQFNFEGRVLNMTFFLGEEQHQERFRSVEAFRIYDSYEDGQVVKTSIFGGFMMAPYLKLDLIPSRSLTEEQFQQDKDRSILTMLTTAFVLPANMGWEYFYDSYVADPYRGDTPQPYRALRGEGYDPQGRFYQVIGDENRRASLVVNHP